MDRARIVAALALLAIIVAGPDRAESHVVDCGKGLVLFGVAAGDASASPPYLKQIEADGWKMETGALEPSNKREAEYADALRRRVAAGRKEGRQRIALAGESFGARVSLPTNAASQTSPDSTSLQAVIAIDAGAAKSKVARDDWRDDKFINLLKAQKEPNPSRPFSLPRAGR